MIEIHCRQARSRGVSLAIDRPVCACFYLALTDPESAPLVTADTRLVAQTRRTRWAGLVATLGSS